MPLVLPRTAVRPHQLVQKHTGWYKPCLQRISLNKVTNFDGTMIFEHYIGIDYSGAEVPISSLKGLRIYEGDRLTPPREVAPPPSPRWYWARREIAEWLVAELSSGPPSIVGIDHGFSFPIRYFQKHRLPLNWPAFLDDFQKHWPTDDQYTYVDFVRDGIRGNGAARSGDSRWRRLTELHARTAKSVFHFDYRFGGKIHSRGPSMAALSASASW